MSGPRIIYVGAYGRSGSTLLGRMLAEAPGAVCVGETRYLWSRGLIDNVSCGCGVPFRECPFWCAIAEQAFGGWEAIDASALAETDGALNRLRTLPAHLAPRLRPRLSGMIEEYVEVLAVLYRAIATVSEAETIIEISKDPTFGCLLGRIPGQDVRAVHLIRDSRAVAYSWTRRRREPSPIAGRQYMPRFNPAETASKWVAYDAALRALPRAGVAYTALTYEALLAAPERTLAELARFAGSEPGGGVAIAGGHVELGQHHMFSGNPMRTSTGQVPLHLDDEWRDRLGARDYAAVTALTWPLLRRYGYPLARRPGGRAVTAALEPRDELART